jgi:hypothetical protein
MTNSGFNQSLSQLTDGSYSNSFSDIETTYSYPINLYSSYAIALSLATLSSVISFIDRSLITKGVEFLSLLSGTKIGRQSLVTRQNANSMYYWNETIVEGTAANTGMTEQLFSFSRHPSLGNDGVTEFSRHLKEVDDLIVFDHKAWSTIQVPNTSPLTYVVGEPTF